MYGSHHWGLGAEDEEDGAYMVLWTMSNVDDDEQYYSTIVQLADDFTKVFSQLMGWQVMCGSRHGKDGIWYYGQ